jgi:hypothetical protein
MCRRENQGLVLSRELANANTDKFEWQNPKFEKKQATISSDTADRGLPTADNHCLIIQTHKY